MGETENLDKPSVLGDYLGQTLQGGYFTGGEQPSPLPWSEQKVVQPEHTCSIWNVSKSSLKDQNLIPILQVTFAELLAFYSLLLPLPHSAASYRSTLLLKSCSSTLDICNETSDSLEADEANLETDYVDFEADEANPAADEVNFEEEEDVDLDISLYLASSSPRKNKSEEGIQISDELGTDQAIGVSELSEEIAGSDMGANNSTLEMSLQLFEDETACSELPILPEQFLSIQEQLGNVQERLMSSRLPF